MSDEDFAPAHDGTRHKPNAFERAWADRSPEAQKAFADDNYEQGRVEFLVRRLGLADHLWPLRRRNKELAGQDKLTFAAFNDRFPTFPFVVGCSTLCGLPLGRGRFTPRDYRLDDDEVTGPGRPKGAGSMAGCFKQFGRSPFFLAYHQFLDAIPKLDERPAAVIFRVGWRMAGLVVHDDCPGHPTDGFAWVYQFPDDGRRLFVRPAEVWADAVRTGGWRPSE